MYITLQSFKIARKLCIKQISFGRVWACWTQLDVFGRDFRSLPARGSRSTMGGNLLAVFPQKQAFKFVLCALKEEFKMRTCGSRNTCCHFSCRVKHQFVSHSFTYCNYESTICCICGSSMSGGENYNFVWTQCITTRVK